MFAMRSIAAALVLVATAFAATLPQEAVARNGVYGGSAGPQHYPLVLVTDAAGQRLKSAVLHVEAACEDTAFGIAADLRAVARRGDAVPFGELSLSTNGRGRFTGIWPVRLSGAEDTSWVSAITVSGRLKRASASGTLVVTSTRYGAAAQEIRRCGPRTLRWTAARGARVFGGATAQDEPVVVQTDARGLKVAKIGYGWRADCTGGGWFDMVENFVNFPLSARGAFGDAFQIDVPEASMLWSYDVRGRVRRGAASGTLTSSVRMPDGTTCATAATRWSAASG